jgi:anaerobic magnesium-protoporphyrin IX monomethyl ester cyclase
MNQPIDCLLIGHNEMDFEAYEKTCRQMGNDSGIYRDLNLNYIRYNNKPYTASGIFNLLNTGLEAGYAPIQMGETFSAAVACLGSYLHKNGLTFDYVNSFREERERLKELLESENILTVAVVTTLYVVALPIIEIIDFIRRHSRTAKIIVGGPFISTQVRTLDAAALEYLFTHTLRADFFVNSSQGEGALVNIIRALKNGSPVETVGNIFYRTDRGGALVPTPVIDEDNPLAENPVKWELFSRGIGDFVNLRTAVSCPFSCSFCGFPEHAGKYRTANLPWIEEQLDRLDRMGVKSIHFIDDTFNVPAARFRDILKLMIRKNYGFKWHSYYRCQFADRDTAALMKESGCDGVFLGIESGSDPVLKNMNKGSDSQRYREGIALLKETGITTFGSFITGFPGETEASVRETVDFIENSGLDFYRTQLWYCEPITPIWREKEKYHLRGEHFEWSHATMDSRAACDHIDQMFLSVKNAIWIPQFDFDFVTIWHIVHRGIGLERVKHFLRNFDLGVREKLTGRADKEAGYDVIKALGEIFPQKEDTLPPVGNGENIVDKYDAGFEF